MSKIMWWANERASAASSAALGTKMDVNGVSVKYVRRFGAGTPAPAPLMIIFIVSQGDAGWMSFDARRPLFALAAQRPVVPL